MTRSPVHTVDSARDGSRDPLKALEAHFGMVLNIRRRAVEDPKAGALVTLVREQAGNVGNVRDSTWQAALDVGWTDSELAESSAVAALNLFTNYFNHLVQTDLDLPPAPEL